MHRSFHVHSCHSFDGLDLDLEPTFLRKYFFRFFFADSQKTTLRYPVLCGAECFHYSPFVSFLMIDDDTMTR